MLLNRVSGPSHPSLSRRGFLRGTFGGVTGLAGWQYGGLGTVAAQKREPGGQMTWAVHFSLAPSWFDPAETPGIVSPFLVLYALHDSLVKPMPGQPQAGSLAESWSVSADGLVYEFVLRQGVKFHNGDPVTTEDVRFSFDRYKGSGATTMKSRMAAVEVVDHQRVRFRLKQPWMDFMTFFGTQASGAAWVVPKKYLERVGDDGFKKAPVGAGPYRFVRFNPGIELVLEAYEQYWRKTPSVKRLIFKTVPDDATRLAMLKRGETDVAYSIRGALAEGLRRTPELTVKATGGAFTQGISFPEQWDPKSPWADRRVRLAANYAVDRRSLNDAEYLGLAKVTASSIPSGFEFAWTPPLYSYDPQKAKQLLAEAGYRSGFNAGQIYTDTVYTSIAEAVANYLKAIGIHLTVSPMERVAFNKALQERKLKNLVLGANAAIGNAATRIEAAVFSEGLYAYGGYPDIDVLFREQAAELDRKKREALLHKIQQLMHQRVMFAPLFEPAFLSGYGPRVAESGLGLISAHLYSAPYEDVKLKAQ
jgi:peptide/nickel transport system substrate-binding protein